MLNVKGILQGNNLTTIAVTAVVVAGLLYVVKGQKIFGVFAAKSDNTARVTHRVNHNIRWIARFIMSHSTNPASLRDRVDQIETTVRNNIAAITQIVKDRLDRKITAREYREKLLLIAKQVAQEMQIVLRSPLPFSRSRGDNDNNSNRPTQAERLAKINEWFGRKQANINEHGENVQKRLAKLNEIKLKKISRTS